MRDESELNETTDLPRDQVADEGRIFRTPTGQTILAVAFLILVTLIAFMGVTLIGQFISNSQVTYWMIELIFALLCGGAGALVGGSAVVRSTLKIPGTPVQATLGGAVSMVIVGFFVAFLGSPQPQEETYSVEILGIPQTPQDVDGAKYNVFVGPMPTSNVSFVRDSDSVTLRVPRRPGDYRVMIAIFQTGYQGKTELSRTLARCQLVFTSTAAAGASLAPMQIVPEGDQQFRLYFPRYYIAKVVRAALSRKDEKAVDDESCIEGHIASQKRPRILLRNDFTLLPASMGTRLSNVARLNFVPRFSIVARNSTDSDPEHPLTDVPPTPDPEATGAIHRLPPNVTVRASVEPATAKREISASPPPPPPLQPASFSAVPGGVAPVKPTVAPESLPLIEQVNAYVRGEDFDRTQLYQSWGKVGDVVVNGFRADAIGAPDRAARYLNLISNALLVIEDGKYLAPTVRPDWDQSTKSMRLGTGSGAGIPGFADMDYRKVVGLLCSQNAEARNAAQRMLRLFPSSRFYRWVQALQKPEESADCDLGFVTETAVYFYYNRIVEYDGTFDLDKASRGWLDGNYDDAIGWINMASARDPKVAAFKALLEYGYGLVLWDHSDREGANKRFESMLRVLTTVGQPYPSNPRHIALALRVMNAPGRISKIARSAAVLDAAELHSLSESYLADGGGVPLFALPDTAMKAIGHVAQDQKARIYLRSERWDLIQAGEKIGWAQRAIASAN